MALIFRTGSIANTGSNYIKNNPLTYLEGDGNLAWLATNMSGSNISITGSTGIIGNTTITGSLSTTQDAIINGLTVGKGSGSLPSNTALGVQALVSSSGDNNVAIGFRTLTANVGGSENVAVGRLALQVNTSGAANCAIGDIALGSNTIGNNNMALGPYALFNNIDGSSNTAMGTQALNNNTSAQWNIGVGRNAGADITTGGTNTFIGSNTGRGITTGTSNTIIGAFVTGLTSTLSNNIIIADGSGNRRINVTATGNVGINTSSPTLATLQVNGNAWANSFTGSLFGTSSWAINALTASFFNGSVNNAVTSSYPISVSGSTIYSTGPSTSAFSTNNSIFLGDTAGSTATSAYNSNFLGNSAGNGATSAYNSNFLGAFSGYNSLNANNCNFFGNSAGQDASLVNNSNFLGNSAGNNATRADNSNFLGASAGQNATRANNSNFLGVAAGASAISASNSNFLGQYAGELADRAIFSNFLGFYSGQSAVSASYSTLMGYQVGYNVAGGDLGVKSNNIIIGTNITLPNGAQDSINLGGIIFATGSYPTTTGNPYSGSRSGTGKVGINVVSPSYELELSLDSAAKPSTNTWTITSDSRVKENVQPYTKGLDIINQINPVTYDYNGKAGFEKTKGNIGIIAQDVKDILPESISTYFKKLNEEDISETELYNFNSHALTYVLINAIKELKAEIDLLKAQK